MAALGDAQNCRFRRRTIKSDHADRPYAGKPVARQSDAGWRSWLSQQGAAPQEVVSAIRSVYSGLTLYRLRYRWQMALSRIEPAKQRKRRSPVCLNAVADYAPMITRVRRSMNFRTAESQSKTVNSYRYRMFSKLNIHGRVELTHWQSAMAQ